LTAKMNSRANGQLSKRKRRQTIDSP